MSRFFARRRALPDADLRAFRADDSVSFGPSRRSVFTWRGEDSFYSSSRRLPPPFVKSVDYGTLPDVVPAPPLVPAGPVWSPSAYVPLSRAPVQVSHGRGMGTLSSRMRPVFVGSRNPCQGRAARREVMFAIGAGGKRLGTKRVRRTADSERSC